MPWCGAEGRSDCLRSSCSKLPRTSKMSLSREREPCAAGRLRRGWLWGSGVRFYFRSEIADVVVKNRDRVLGLFVVSR
jgi:hypothetical protein